MLRLRQVPWRPWERTLHPGSIFSRGLHLFLMAVPSSHSLSCTAWHLEPPTRTRPARARQSRAQRPKLGCQSVSQSLAMARPATPATPATSQESPMKTFPIELGAIGGARCWATSGVKHGSRSTRPNYCWAEAYDHFSRMPLVTRLLSPYVGRRSGTRACKRLGPKMESMNGRSSLLNLYFHRGLTLILHSVRRGEAI